MNCVWNENHRKCIVILYALTLPLYDKNEYKYEMSKFERRVENKKCKKAFEKYNKSWRMCIIVRSYISTVLTRIRKRTKNHRLIEWAKRESRLPVCVCVCVYLKEKCAEWIHHSNIFQVNLVDLKSNWARQICRNCECVHSINNDTLWMRPISVYLMK